MGVERDCFECGGNGQVWTLSPGYGWRWEECWACMGSGEEPPLAPGVGQLHFADGQMELGE